MKNISFILVIFAIGLVSCTGNTQESCGSHTHSDGTVHTHSHEHDHDCVPEGQETFVVMEAEHPEEDKPSGGDCCEHGHVH